MTKPTSRLAAGAESEPRWWRAVAIIGVLPGLVHLVILFLALVGVQEIAIWINEKLLVPAWSVAILWVLVIGGPLISVIAGLILKLWRRSAFPFANGCSVIAWILLIIGFVTCFPFP